MSPVYTEGGLAPAYREEEAGSLQTFNEPLYPSYAFFQLLH
jgi:hypothetical protein